MPFDDASLEKSLELVRNHQANNVPQRVLQITTAIQLCKDKGWWAQVTLEAERSILGTQELQEALWTWCEVNKRTCGRLWQTIPLWGKTDSKWWQMNLEHSMEEALERLSLDYLSVTGIRGPGALRSRKNVVWGWHRSQSHADGMCACLPLLLCLYLSNST